MTHHCNRCKLAIDTNEERYVVVEDKKGKEQLSKLWFHKECWREIMAMKEKTNKLQEDAEKMMNFAKKQLGMNDNDIEEVYQLIK